MNLRKTIGLIILIAVFIYYIKNNQNEVRNLAEKKASPSNTESAPKKQNKVENSEKKTVSKLDSLFKENQRGSRENAPTPNPSPIKLSANQIKVPASNNSIKPESSLHFKVEDGLVVVEGDVVLGTPINNNIPNEGQIETPTLRLWEGGEIPFNISSDLPQSKRVLDAFQLFKDTPIQFVPLDTQQDGIVFIEGKNTCKSYLGKMGGLQPLWVAPDCTPADIAHELMHALGFVHEQNRSDRDHFVTINWESIQKQYIHNFELLPLSLMEVSASGPFDYQSIMIYPEKAFAINADFKTILSKTDKVISPMKKLSATDIARLQKIYGR